MSHAKKPQIFGLKKTAKIEMPPPRVRSTDTGYRPPPRVRSTDPGYRPTRPDTSYRPKRRA